MGVEGTVVGHDISMDFFGMHILGAVIESAEGDRYVVGALSSADMGDLVDFYVDRDDPPIDDVGFMTTELAIRGTATPWYWHAMRAVVTLGLSVAGVVFYRRWRKGEVGSLSPG